MKSAPLSGATETPRPGGPDDVALAPRPSPRQLKLMLAILATAVGALAAINLSPLMESWSVRRLLDLNGEITLAVWLSSSMLLGIGGVALALALYESVLPGSRRRALGWLAMAVLFAALSADETAAIHELVGLIASTHLFQLEALPGVFVWVAVLAPVGLVVAFAVFRWLREAVGWKQPHGRLGLLALAVWAMVPVLEALDPALGGPVWLHVAEECAEFGGEILMLACILGELQAMQRRHPLALIVDPHREEPPLPEVEVGADGVRHVA